MKCDEGTLNSRGPHTQLLDISRYDMRLGNLFKLVGVAGTMMTTAACGAHAAADVNGQNDASHAALAASIGLHTRGNQILDVNDQVWMARGVNIFDTRGCNACAYNNPDVNEVLRRADTAITQWHANLIRLNLESYASASGRTQWAGVLQDANYLADIKSIVDHISQYRGVTILMSLLIDPTFNAQEIPTPQTAAEWTLLSKTFANYPNVIFGVGNEPHTNSTDSASTIADQNENCWQGMTESVNAIRAAENSAGVAHHLISVQGTLWWARFTAYYEAHPIQSDNIIYETHIYDNTSVFPTELTQPHQTLPMIIGEFGAWPGEMDMADCTNLMNLADQLRVPYIGWSFSASCGAAPLLQTTTTDTCGIDMPLVPTAWGTLLKTHLLAMQPDAPVFTAPAPAPTPTTGAADTNGNNTVVTLPPTGATATPTPTPTVTPVVKPTPTPSVAPIVQAAPTPTATPAGSAIGLATGGVCVDVMPGTTANGSGIVIFSCDSAQASQAWTYAGGTFKTQGKCIAIVNNVATAGAFLEPRALRWKGQRAVHRAGSRDTGRRHRPMLRHLRRINQQLDPYRASSLQSCRHPNLDRALTRRGQVGPSRKTIEPAPRCNQRH